MRKIKTQETIERAQKRNKIIIGLVFVGLMVISTLGFALLSRSPSEQNPENKISYNGIDFVYTENNVWQAQIGSATLTTINNPEQTEDIKTDFNFSISEIYSKPLYFAFINYSDTQAYDSGKSEILRNLAPYIARSSDVCLKGEKCNNDNLAEKNCTSNVIVFKISDTIKTYKTENCVFIESSYSEQALISDKIIFK